MFPWFSFLTYAVITSVTPGPNNIFSMANGNRLGFRRALPFNLGVWTGFSVVMLLCTAFCSFLSGLLPKIKLPMLLLGAAYMLYLAWHTFRSSGELQQSESKNGFVSGLLLQFVNPKIYIYCIVSMEAYIFPYYQQQPLVLAAFAPIDLSLFVGNLLGAVFLGLALIAIGVFISSLTESQVIAAVASFAVMMGLMLIDTLSSVMPTQFLQDLVYGLSFYTRYANFTLGLLNIADVIFFLSVSGLFIFFTVRVLEKKRWS